MTTYASSIAMTLTGYTIMAAAYYGWGELVSRILRLGLKGGERVFSQLWLGWCGALLLLQIINFIVPITALVSIAVYSTGILLFLSLSVRQIDILRHARSTGVIVYWILLALFAIWTASWSTLSPTNYDSGLYHFNSVRWINEYPIVTGIGNLHRRLAFNQSFFTYAASLNLKPFFTHGHNLANSYLVLLLFAESLFTVVHSGGGKRSEKKDIGVVTFLSFCFIPVAIVISVTNSLSSPTPDIATSVLQLVLFLHFARHMEERNYRDSYISRVAVILVLAATAITVKMSIMMYAATIVLLAAILLWHGRKGDHAVFLRQAAVLLAAPALIGIVWMAKSYLQSGYPLFPATFGGIDFDWSVPRALAIEETRWIYSWARLPGLNPDRVLGSWNWLGPWMTNLFAHTETIVYPLSVSALAVAGWILLIVIRPMRFTNKVDKMLFLLPVPMLAGLAFWFFTAPDPRFAGVIFFLLPPAALYPLLKFIAPGPARNGGLFTVMVFTVIAYGAILLWIVGNAPIIVKTPQQGYGPVPVIPMQVQTTFSGLRIWVPVHEDQCWDSELPSTPYFDKYLHLRGSTVRSGFSVK
ncbi:MAG: hypothetical protein OEW15_11780 [Nitrospirota bacterium]|nr:hypothetical protein [Nitrospirota bacterium]